MELLDNLSILDRQEFEWGDISWLHEPMGSPHRRLSVAKVNIYPSCQQEKHFHLGEEQFFYVIKGKGTFITNGKKEDICENMMVYIPPHSVHEVINSGNENLVFLVVYVPINLIQLEKPYMITEYKNIQDAIPIEILQNIKDQLSDLLKIVIHIYDANHNLITVEKEKKDFCVWCTYGNSCTCNKKSDFSDGGNPLFGRVYKCEYDLIELEIPIIFNENIVGYIKSENFTLSTSQEVMKKIDSFGRSLDIDIWEIYNKTPSIIKSRVYVIQEHLAIASQFIQIMLERAILEHELIKKDNEILINAKEKIQLKDALTRANNKIFHDKIFIGGSNGKNEVSYPFDLELILEEAIKEFDTEKINKNISHYKRNCYDGEKIVQEMIIVLSRTALRSLEDVRIITSIRKKYDEFLRQTKKEDPWDILKQFCIDCIGEYKKVMESNGRELIDNINMFIDQHYREDLNLNQIAEAFYISPNYLSSLFNQKNNISLSDYIQRLRIEEAKRYLNKTNIKVCDIAKRIGYKSNSYFVNIFKKNVGMTPNEYRKSI